MPIVPECRRNHYYNLGEYNKYKIANPRNKTNLTNVNRDSRCLIKANDVEAELVPGQSKDPYQVKATKPGTRRSEWRRENNDMRTGSRIKKSSLFQMKEAMVKAN